jgi:hypothetical protein
MLSVIMLNVIMVSVVAPLKGLFLQFNSISFFLSL